MDLEKDQLLQKRKEFIFPIKALLYDEPIQLIKAKGSRVWDEQGQEYLDAIGGIVSISVGHNHPKIVEEMKSMLESNAIQHTTHLYLSSYMVELAEKLAALAPGDLKQCYLTNSGSEANEMAVLTARLSTGQQIMVALKHGYHGGTTTPLSLCGNHHWKFSSDASAGCCSCRGSLLLSLSLSGKSKSLCTRMC